MEEIDKLLDSIKTTAGNRFNAAKRLEARDRHITWLTAISSVYVIFLTVLPYICKFPKDVTDILNLAVIFFSIIILVSSLIHNSNKDAVNAEQHHRSALEINELYRDVKVAADLSQESQIKEVVQRYNSILQKYSLNHDDIDYMRYQLERPEQFPWLTRRKRVILSIELYWIKHVYIIWSILATALFVWLVFFYALPRKT